MASIKKRPDGQWRALSPLASEDELARRISYERDRRSWSPGGLASLMTKAGCPMNQSAIWKIENGEPRRKITVDEALAFAIQRELPLYILPTFGTRPLASLRRAHIEEWAKSLPLAPSSARMVYETFSGMLSAAVDDERLTRNPATGARLAKADEAPFVPLTAEEIGAIARSAAETCGPR